MLSVVAGAYFHRLLTRLNKVEQMAPPQTQSLELPLSQAPGWSRNLTFVLHAGQGN